MNKDLSHLMKIVDRFSKIGSETPLTPENINENSKRIGDVFPHAGTPQRSDRL